MGRLRRKRMHKNIKDLHKKYKTKRKTKDLDQIHEDFDKNLEQITNPAIDPDMPGLGQFYCIHCARHFVEQGALDKHIKSKVHKRRLKELRDAPYTEQEALAAAGKGSYEKPGQKLLPNISVGSSLLPRTPGGDVANQEASAGLMDAQPTTSS